MGQETNLAVVRAMFEEFAEGRSDTAFAAYDDAVVWDSRSATVPELSGVFTGHDEVRKWWEIWLGAWERIMIVSGPDHFENGNQIASIWIQENVGKGSGAHVRQEAGLVWTFQTGRIVRVAVFTDCASALAAAGIDGEGGTSARG